MQAASRPASAGRVPSIGSTIRTNSGSPSPGRDHPAVLGVERHLRRVGGDPAGEELLGLGVDRERHVAAHALARVRATVRRAEAREHDLAQRVREIEGDAAHPAGARLRRQRPLAELELDRALVAVAPDLDGHLLARVEQLDRLGEVVGVADRAVVEAGDDVAALGERAVLEADLALAAAEPGLLGPARRPARPAATRPA